MQSNTPNQGGRETALESIHGALPVGDGFRANLWWEAAENRRVRNQICEVAHDVLFVLVSSGFASQRLLVSPAAVAATSSVRLGGTKISCPRCLFRVPLGRHGPHSRSDAVILRVLVDRVAKQLLNLSSRGAKSRTNRNTTLTNRLTLWT